MKFGDAVGFALTSLRKRRLRTFLTAAGVTIGIGALVCMISFGKGMQKNVTEAFKSADLFNSLMVMPGGPSEPAADPDEPRARPASPAGRTVVLDDAAVAKILKIPGVLTAYPEINFPALVKLGGKEEFRLVQVVPAAVAASPAVRVKWGRAYKTDGESGVIVSGSFARRLGQKDPAAVVGQTLRITSVSFDIGKLASLDLTKLFAGGGLPVSQESYEFPVLGVTELGAFGEGGPGLGQNDVFLPPGPARG
ncbi:MAG TPA: ABC transporter permease, partial [Acidobacteriota bacterium]|nr:ABC transporter permease [Acidobacteriota bacterium]